MDRETQELVQQFRGTIERMLARSSAHLDRVVGPDNVYQEKVEENRADLKRIIDDLLLEGSGIQGLEHLEELGQLAAAGHSCLLLPAHLSNFDVPVFWELMNRAGPKFGALFEKIVFLAGRKLNEESDIVKMFTEMFTRLVISPKTFYESLPEGEERQRVMQETRAVNLAAHRKMRELMHQDRIFLVYPTGTRFRPWEPASGRGLREVENYLRSFEYFVVGATRGNLLPPAPTKMHLEHPVGDRVLMKFGLVHDARIFRTQCLERLAASPEKKDLDSKQYIVDQVMEEMKALEKSIE